jgi:predicted amidohydrolase YtcJ
VVTNGKILTVHSDFRVVEAFAINDGRSSHAVRAPRGARYAGPDTRIIDVKSATVIPGLIDNHFHFTRAVERWHQQARFEGVNSRHEALRILATKTASLKPGEWIMVQGGWTPRQFADAPGGFTLEELDRLRRTIRCSSRKVIALPCVRQQYGAKSRWVEPG